MLTNSNKIFSVSSVYRRSRIFSVSNVFHRSRLKKLIADAGSVMLSMAAEMYAATP